MSVVQHSPVHHSFVVFCEVLKVLIVGRYHRPRLLFPELFQHSFGDCTAYLRLRARSELVYQDERVAVCLPHHGLHVHQMR